MFGLFILVPTLRNRFNIHESAIIGSITTLSVIANTGMGTYQFHFSHQIHQRLRVILSAFSRSLIPDYYASTALDSLRICIYSLNRSLITSCIDDHEIGKVFAAVAVFAALVPVVSTPAFR